MRSEEKHKEAYRLDKLIIAKAKSAGIGIRI